MFELLITALSLSSTVMVAVLIVFLYKFNRGIPDLIQGVLNDVGGQLDEIFKNPVVKGVMSSMGKKSGDVRANKALKNKVAEKALGGNVLLKKALEYLDITPMEGLELMGDPTVGPVIRNLMAGFQKGGSNLLSGLGGGNSPNISHGNSNRVPNMS